jgi:hypothetical protein
MARRTRFQARRSTSHAHRCIDPSPADVYAAAKDYVASGFSLIPIRADYTKWPAFEVLPRVPNQAGQYKPSWNIFRKRLPTADELALWFLADRPSPFGFAVVTGQMSGGLEVIDIDDAELIDAWRDLVKRQAPGLLGRLVQVETPRPGFHFYFRSNTCGRGQPLASKGIVESGTLTARRKVQIEMKGDGNICTAPPTPRGVHIKGFYQL